MGKLTNVSGNTCGPLPVFSPKLFMRQSIIPTAFIPVLNTNPRYNTKPMLPPNSGPSERDIR